MCAPSARWDPAHCVHTSTPTPSEAHHSSASPLPARLQSPHASPNTHPGRRDSSPPRDVDACACASCESRTQGETKHVRIRNNA